MGLKDWFSSKKEMPTFVMETAPADTKAVTRGGGSVQQPSDCESQYNNAPRRQQATANAPVERQHQSLRPSVSDGDNYRNQQRAPQRPHTRGGDSADGYERTRSDPPPLHHDQAQPRPVRYWDGHKMATQPDDQVPEDDYEDDTFDENPESYYGPPRSSRPSVTGRVSDLTFEGGEPIIVGGLETVATPPLPVQPDTAILENVSFQDSSFAVSDVVPQEAQRSSLLDVIRFSWLKGNGTRSQSAASQSEAGRTTQGDSLEVAGRPSIDIDGQLPNQDAGVVMKGWLEKCGQQFKTWNWRYFVLREDGVLAYYTDEHLKKLKGSINVGYGSKADITMQSNMIDKKFIFMITTTQRNMMIAAPSQKMMTKWIAKLHAAGATPSEPWDPSKKTVKFFVKDSECPHEWKRYDDPTCYIHMEGCLLKRGHVNKNWKNRFFRIERGELRYYTENQEQLKGAVPLKGTIVSPGMAQCPDGRKNYFVLTSKDGKFEMHLNAPNEQVMHRWIEALQEAQTALADRGAKGTVHGLALVIKRAEEIPLAKVEIEFTAPEEINVELQRRTEALIVSKSPTHSPVAMGSQLIAVGGTSVLRETYAAARQTLRAATFPLHLSFVLPPYKEGELIKKSRSGFENWKKRVVVVTNGEIHYYKQVIGANKTTSLKHRKSFSLTGCYLNLITMPGREFCIIVARSPSDKLVLETRSEEERTEWASVIYASIRIVSQGVTPAHIENLQLEVASEASAGSGATTDLKGSFGSEAKLQF